MSLDASGLAGLFLVAQDTFHHYVLLKVFQWRATNQTFFVLHNGCLFFRFVFRAGRQDKTQKSRKDDYRLLHFELNYAAKLQKKAAARRPRLEVPAFKKDYSMGIWITDSHFSGSSWFQAPSM